MNELPLDRVCLKEISWTTATNPTACLSKMTRSVPIWSFMMAPSCPSQTMRNFWGPANWQTTRRHSPRHPAPIYRLTTTFLRLLTTQALLLAISPLVTSLQSTPIPIVSICKWPKFRQLTLSPVTTYKLQTQQQPDGDAIDIIGLSEMCILGQIDGLNKTNGTAGNTTMSSLHGKIARSGHRSTIGHSHHHSHMFSPRAVEGPIQCGIGMPCKDGACCNKDGKW